MEDKVLLKEIRRVNKWTQRELAIKLNVDSTQISRWERGVHSIGRKHFDEVMKFWKNGGKK